MIARLDPSLFEAQLQQARANLQQARANLTKAQSDLDRAKVMLTDAQQKYTRAKELAAKSLLPQSDLDAAKIAVDSAQATLASSDATVAQAQAAVNQSQASVNQNQVNLDHTIIEAPIDGIVIQRTVDVGQTVAASMQAPTLFIIAADLTKMQVNANIDEADVGRIRPDSTSRSRSTPTRPTPSTGRCRRSGCSQSVVQNVTTYGTVIDVPNAQLKLKPGMTANVKVEIAKRSDVLRVPNAALRFRPSTDSSPRSTSRCRLKCSAPAAAGAGAAGGTRRQPERRRRQRDIPDDACSVRCGGCAQRVPRGPNASTARGGGAPSCGPRRSSAASDAGNGGGQGGGRGIRSRTHDGAVQGHVRRASNSSSSTD